MARVLAAAHWAVTAERPVVVARVTSGPDGRAGRTIALLEDRHLGSTGRADLDAAVLAHERPQRAGTLGNLRTTLAHTVHQA
ncbi:hypothetical protein ACH4SK_32400 [Streptomyces inhibens]|uniref:hypothetical protein n=1 Tax=Streptomyces inhibens TaxID=2293571 RepID=UPI003795B399